MGKRNLTLHHHKHFASSAVPDINHCNSCGKDLNIIALKYHSVIVLEGKRGMVSLHLFCNSCYSLLNMADDKIFSNDNSSTEISKHISDNVLKNFSTLKPVRGVIEKSTNKFRRTSEGNKERQKT